MEGWMIGAGIAGAVMVLLREWRAERLESLRTAFRLAAAGIGSSAHVAEGGERIDAMIEGVAVRASVEGERMVVRGLGAPEEIAVARRSHGTFGPQLPESSVIPTGDPVFDEHLWAGGLAVDVRAFADHTFRARFLELLRLGDAELRGGQVELIATLDRLDPARIQLLLGAVAAVVRATLDVPEDRAAALARVARSDTVARVRFLALRDLASVRPDVARQLAHEAASDPAPITRAMAGALLEEEGLPILRELMATAPDVEAAVIASRLIARANDREAEPALIAALSQPDIRIRRMAIEILEQLGTVRAVEPLLDLASRPATITPEKVSVGRAVQAIQQRLAGAEPGRISLSDSAVEGAVSLTSAERGALSKS